MIGFLRFLFFLAVAYLLISGIRRLFLPTSSPQRNRSEGKGQEGMLMVKDPQCGRFVLEGEAIRTSFRGQVLHFCSLECRDRYMRSSA